MTPRRWSALALGVAFLGGACTSAEPPKPDRCDGLPRKAPDALVLDYGDFGPQAMSFGLIGMGWWQWDGEGHAFDDEGGVIRVVVHTGPRDDMVARYPVDEARHCDHRYITKAEAVAYLKDHIAELKADGSLPGLRKNLETTLGRLDGHFGATRK